MHYNQLGNTGLVVSKLSLGAMNFGHYNFNGFKSKVDEPLARKMMFDAIDCGVNVIDTADMYGAGQSEEIIGRNLGSHRKDVILVTKAFFRTSDAIKHAGLSRLHILEACTASLKRLETDHVDLFLLHAFDPVTPLEETARALDDLQRKGMARYVGCSNFAAWHAQKLVDIQKELGLAPLGAHQVYYSLLGRDIEHDIVPQSQDAGLGLMAWSPTAGGFLTGKYTRDDPEGHGGRRATFDFPPIDKDKGFEVVAQLTEMAKARDCTPTQLAMAWVMDKPHVATTLFGATTMEQFNSTLAACDIKLTAEETQSLDDLTAPVKPYPQWIYWGDPTVQKALTTGWKPEK